MCFLFSTTVEIKYHGERERKKKVDGEVKALGIYLVIGAIGRVQQDWHALVSSAKGEGRLGLDPGICWKSPSRLIFSRSHPGSSLARIWPFRVILIGCRARRLLDDLPLYLGAP